jgi:hypothetical protein
MQAMICIGGRCESSQWNGEHLFADFQLMIIVPTPFNLYNISKYSASICIYCVHDKHYSSLYANNKYTSPIRFKHIIELLKA